MKRIVNLSRFTKTVASIVIIAILFSACKKSTLDIPATPAAGVMAFNLIPDKTIGFTVSGDNLTRNALPFTSYTGAYLPVYPGAREVKSYNIANGIQLASTSGTFADSLYYSVFAVGLNGSYRNIITQDHLNELTKQAGKAYVRYINAITDSTATPTVTITSGGSAVVNSGAAYASVSGFTAVPAGIISIAVAGGTEFNSARTITAEENKVYTVLLLGTPGSSDSSSVVQIKYINNGIVN